MTLENSKKDQFITRLKRAETALQMSILLYQKEILDFSSALGAKIYDDLQRFLNEMRSENPETQTYLDMALKNKFSNFEKNAQIVKTISEDFQQNPGKENTENFFPALQALHAYIGTLQKEIHLVYGGPNPWLVKFQKRKKEILLGLGAIVLVGGIFGLIFGIYQSRRGLMGHYYTGTNFNKLVKVKVNQTINYSWKRQPPFRGLPYNEFSVRWEGFIKIPESGRYDFYTLSDDGVRLFIDGREIISNWTRHYPQLDKAETKLEQGYHRIRLEYFEKYKDATIKLYWRKEYDSDRSIIPSSALVPHEKYLDKNLTVHEIDPDSETKTNPSSES